MASATVHSGADGIVRNAPGDVQELCARSLLPPPLAQFIYGSHAYAGRRIAVGLGLLRCLQQVHPGDFTDGQLRTLQRRVREWRQVMAKKLVYACLDGDEETSEAVLVGETMEPSPQRKRGDRMV